MPTNLLNNPGLENGDDGAWQFSSGCTLPGGNIINEPANARTGNFRLMVRAGKSGLGSQTCGTYNQRVPVVAGKKYQFAGYYKVPTVDPTVTCEVKVLGNVPYFTQLINAVQATYKALNDLTFIAQSPDTLVNILIQANPPVAGNPGFFNFYFDDFFFAEVLAPQGIAVAGESPSTRKASLANPLLRSATPSASPSTVKVTVNPRAIFVAVPSRNTGTSEGGPH